METEAKPRIGTLATVRRRAVSGAGQEWIKTTPLFSEENSCLLVQPAVDGVNLLEWAKSHASLVETLILKHGALLFRDFDIRTVPDFESFIGLTSGGAEEYRLRAGPRTKVSGHIYTSTDYPADQPIFAHNEGAFQPNFPLRVFFYCVTAAPQGGETPIGNNRRIFERIPPSIKARFRELRVLYVRNFGGRFGLPWQTVFSTEDKAEVEAICTRNGVEFEWKGDDWVRTKVVGPAVIKHPRTGELVWFNHATFFHVTTLPATIRDGLLAAFREEDLPNNTYYGDGSPIEPETLETLRGIYRDELRMFSWQPGDILAVDNVLTVHARSPFAGPRKVVVGLADGTNWKDVWA